MELNANDRFAACVSLFTREWIEISQQYSQRSPPWSPSLRGSGLKLKLTLLSPRCAASPSLRGSGLKLWRFEYKLYAGCLPLYEGVD